MEVDAVIEVAVPSRRRRRNGEEHIEGGHASCIAINEEARSVLRIDYSLAAPRERKQTVARFSLIRLNTSFLATLPYNTLPRGKRGVNEVTGSSSITDQRALSLSLSLSLSLCFAEFHLL
jgi:hypothetical protein